MFKGVFNEENSNNIKRKKMKNITGIIVGVIAALIILLAAIGSFYTVSDKEVAVVTTFGAITDVTEAGVHFKLPFGIQEIQRVKVSGIHKIELGYSSDDVDNYVENESKMISGDFNIVNIDFFIEYKIVDPKKYLYSSDKPEDILKMLAQSQIRNVVGSTQVDMILTAGKENIEIAVKELVIEELKQYDIGIALYTVKIQDAEPPTEDVRAAFKAVETAKQDSETAQNNALAYKEQKLPKAEAEADKLTKNAEFLKQNRINEAKQEVALFNAMFEEYILNPDMTRTRMYYETVEKVLPGVKLYVDASDGNVSKILPIEPFTNTDESNKEDNKEDNKNG